MASSEVQRSQPEAILTDRPVTRRAVTYTLCLAAILCPFAVTFAMSMLQSNPLGSDRTWGSGLLTIILLGLTIAQALNLARLSSERYVVTGEAIEISSGILRRDARKIPFSRVLDITSNSSFDRRLFGVGSITVSIANGNTITLEDITDSRTKAEILWNLVHQT